MLGVSFWKSTCTPSDHIVEARRFIDPRAYLPVLITIRTISELSASFFLEQL